MVIVVRLAAHGHKSREGHNETDMCVCVGMPVGALVWIS